MLMKTQKESEEPPKGLPEAIATILKVNGWIRIGTTEAATRNNFDCVRDLIESELRQWKLANSAAQPAPGWISVSLKAAEVKAKYEKAIMQVLNCEMPLAVADVFKLIPDLIEDMQAITSTYPLAEVPGDKWGIKPLPAAPPEPAQEPK